MTDVYSAPGSELSRPKKGNKWIAIIVGVAVDYGLSTLSGMILGVVLTFRLLRQGMPQSEVQAHLAQQVGDVMHSGLGYGLSAMGLLFTFLGSYLAARIANDKEYRVATILVAVSVVMFLRNGNTYFPAWLHYCLFVLNTSVIYLGAYFHVSNKV